MPKGKGDPKRHERQEKRRLRNRSVRSAVKTYITRARQAIVQVGPAAEETQSAILRALRELDRAARKKVIHRNNAARRKSRLIRRLRAAEATASVTTS
jgi:small subunit ribosomal protein S20